MPAPAYYHGRRRQCLESLGRQLVHPATPARSAFRSTMTGQRPGSMVRAAYAGAGMHARSDNCRKAH